MLFSFVLSPRVSYDMLSVTNVPSHYTVVSVPCDASYQDGQFVGAKTFVFSDGKMETTVMFSLTTKCRYQILVVENDETANIVANYSLPVETGPGTFSKQFTEYLASKENLMGLINKAEDKSQHPLPSVRFPASSSLPVYRDAVKRIKGIFQDPLKGKTDMKQEVFFRLGEGECKVKAILVDVTAETIEDARIGNHDCHFEVSLQDRTNEEYNPIGTIKVKENAVSKHSILLALQEEGLVPGYERIHEPGKEKAVVPNSLTLTLATDNPDDQFITIVADHMSTTGDKANYSISRDNKPIGLVEIQIPNKPDSITKEMIFRAMLGEEMISVPDFIDGPLPPCDLVKRG